MSKQPFIHLHVHSSYSLLEGAMSIGKLADLAKHDKMPALALTDTYNLFGALEFSEKMASSGIQPLIGLAMPVHFKGSHEQDERKIDHPHCCMLFYAMNEMGYQNLMALSSQAYKQGVGEHSIFIDFDVLKSHAEGLIVLSGGSQGPIGFAIGQGQMALAQERFESLKELFGDRFYINLERHGWSVDSKLEPHLLHMAYAGEVGIVATNGCYFADKDDYDAHDALLAIAEGVSVGQTQRRQMTPQHCFKTQEDMQLLFADLPEAIENTVVIAKRCHWRPKVAKPMLPRFSSEETGGEVLDESVELKRQALSGLEFRLEQHGVAAGFERQAYLDRLEFELGVIGRMQYAGYFLIVSDFIKWAKKQGIPVGPGRGSGAGSLVAYSLMITDLDPIRFGLLFERFLNPDRVSMPDFDIDFCQERRDEVIDYVGQKYGRDKVAQIITFGTLQARGVMRDVGRVLEMPYGQVDRLCKLVPQNPANPVTLGQALETEPKLNEEAKAEPVVRRMLDIALRLEGLHRHASTHAAGIVIADRPLQNVVPLYFDPRSEMPVTQFNMKWVEQAGLVKFDFLGLKTLSILQEACHLLRERGEEVDIGTIALDDRPTFEMLSRGETMGVFQLESAGMRKALLDMRPDRLEDIIALVALYRPGPMANIPTYCLRKHGLENPEYMHPKLEPYLKETFGVIIYQEQVMQIAQALAGYSLGEADLLRRAMGKKIKSEMAQQRSRFVEGAVANGVEKAQADSIFDLLAKFADYGFNKSHAAAYALVAYQTAYMKAHYAAEFLAASMTFDMGNTDKLSEFRQEAMKLGIAILPPSVQSSGVKFKPEGSGIRYALSALKGFGVGAAQALVDARGVAPFETIDDFLLAVGSKGVNKKSLEALAASGAFDAFESNRARFFHNVDFILREAHNRSDDKSSGQEALFGGEFASKLILPQQKPWLHAEMLQKEHDAVGFYLSGHPLERQADLVKSLNGNFWQTFQAEVRRGAVAGRLVASVLGRQERRTKSGSKMGIFSLSDPTGQYEAIMFSEGLMQFRDVFEEGQLVVMQVSASAEGDEVRVRIVHAEPLDVAAKRALSNITIELRHVDALGELTKLLSAKGKGKAKLVLNIEDQQMVEISLPGTYGLDLTLADKIRHLAGVEHVTLG